MSQELLDERVIADPADLPADTGEPVRWTISIDDGLKVRVPASLDLMTPYVLLEQERWFETEIDFIKRFVQPGWQVLDIGANYGMYTLTMARAVGPKGRVFAFEPSSATADCLAESCALNGFDHVQLNRCALAEEPGRGVLSAESNTELGQLTEASDGSGHAVEIETLDNLADRFADAEIGFVKMDAEGAETRILAGAGAFMARHAPIFMFEIKHGNGINHALIAAFRDLGYEIYTHIPGLNALVVHQDGDELDGYQLNCFAIPPARRAELAARDLIADPGTPVPDVCADLWRQAIALLPADSAVQQRWHALDPESADDGWAVHRDALNLMMFAHDAGQPVGSRYAALTAAVGRLRDLIAREGNVARLCTLTRGLLDLGQRVLAVQVLQRLGGLLTTARKFSLPEPLLPFTAEMEGASAHLKPDTWIYLWSVEALQRAAAYSGYFSAQIQISMGQSATNLPGHSTEAERRFALASLRGGAKFPVRCRNLTKQGPNAAIWAEIAGLTTPVEPSAAAAPGATGEPAQKPGLVSVLRPETDIVVADIGAMLLGEHAPDYQRLLDAGVARIVGFEPNAKEHARLEQAFPAPHVFHRAFIGSGGPATYFETVETMTGSLYEPNTTLLANYDGLAEQLKLVARHPVETSTLDEVLGDTDVDMIKIDVQGAELDVFKGAERALASAVVVHTEVEFAELYKNQPLFGDIDRFLSESGFQFLTFCGMSGRPTVAPSGTRMPKKLRATQLLWADVVYVPKITALSALPSHKLTKLACIAHLLYGANDLAWRVLSELDSRDGGRRAQRFTDQVKLN